MTVDGLCLNVQLFQVSFQILQQQNNKFSQISRFSMSHPRWVFLQSAIVDFMENNVVLLFLCIVL